MPSPFPGMDPYLEGELELNLHWDLSGEIRRQLVRKLPKGYYPFMSRCDLFDGYAEAPNFLIEIRRIQDRELVTLVGLLSAAAKREPGRRKHLRERRWRLRDTVHVLDIDLLRTGERLPLSQDYPASEYCVILSRAEDRPQACVWPIRLDQGLPIVPVPMHSQPDVSLDLQAAFTAFYDASGMADIVNYREPPDVPFTADQAAWADQLLRGKGLRSSFTEPEKCQN
jgi:hypothetical protein